MLPIVVVAPEYFNGNVEMGVVSQASSAFGHILDDLSIVVNSFTDVSKFSAGIDRLFSFLSAIIALDPHRRSMGSLLSIPDPEKKDETPSTSGHMMSENTGINVIEFDPFEQSASSTILSTESLCLSTPDNKRTLMQNLNLSLQDGKNLLIVGASGSGKSSFLRAIAGLWSEGSGLISRPSASHVYFLPQRPYCPPGTLRDQLLYPSTETKDDHFALTGIDGSEHRPDGGRSPNDQRRLWKNSSDGALLNVLQQVSLPHLAERSGNGNPYKGLNAVLDWSNTLSLGEQQRLAFGRLVINRPRLVVMDESTSALDVIAEKKMYSLLKDLSSGGNGVEARLTYISVGHRPTLLSHHDVKLSIRDGFGYVSNIPMSTTSNTIDEGFIY